MPSLNKVEKKIAQLKANKEKEEKRLKDNLDKLTAKYNEDQKNLKVAFDAKVAEAKAEGSSRIARITPEIDFLEKQRKDIIKLQAQMEQLERAYDDRMSSGKASSSGEGDEGDEIETDEITESESDTDFAAFSAEANDTFGE